MDGVIIFISIICFTFYVYQHYWKRFKNNGTALSSNLRNIGS